MAAQTGAGAGEGVGEQWQEWDARALAALGVPVIQAVCATGSRATWVESDSGLSPLDAATQVELGDRDLRRGVQRGEARVALQPRRARAGRATAWSTGTSSAASAAASQSCHGRVLLAARVARARAAGREHRRQQRVDVSVEQSQRGTCRRPAAQRVAPDRERVAAGVLDRAQSPSTKAVLPVSRCER